MVARLFVGLSLLCLGAVGCQSFGPMAAISSGAIGNQFASGPQAAPVPHDAPMNGSIETPATSLQATNNQTATAATPTTKQSGPYNEPTEQEAMAAVGPKLSELAQKSPEQHAKVLQQLATAPPSLWELTVDRALSTVEYRADLAAQESLKPQQPMTTPSVIPNPKQEIVMASASLPTTERGEEAPRPTGVAASIPPQESAAKQQPSSPAQWINNSHVEEPRVVSRSDSMPKVITNDLIDQASSEQAALDWRSSLDATITLLENQAPDQPQSTEEAYEHARLRLLQLAAGRGAEAYESIPGLTAIEQGYWADQLYSVSTLLDVSTQPETLRRAAAAATHHARAAGKLRSLSSLQVRNVSFCSKVYGFGAYEPITSPRFRSGEQATLYAEVDNYQSDSTSEGHRTSLSSSYRVLNRDGDPVDDGEFPVVDDLCMSLRRDFHIQYGVVLPAGLAAGEYTLELTITDQLSGKIGRDKLDFTIIR